jgi:hypothetical protein
MPDDPMRPDPMKFPEFKLGVQRALSAAGKCGASCPDEEPEYTACVRERGHAGMHDGLFHPPWGDREATVEQNGKDAAESWRAVHAIFYPMPGAEGA